MTAIKRLGDLTIKLEMFLGIRSYLNAVLAKASSDWKANIIPS